MVRLFQILLIAGLCAFSTHAFAQSGRQEADALIRQSGHPQLFQNASTDEEMAILHLASGMKCKFTPGSSENSFAGLHSDSQGRRRGLFVGVR